MTKYQCVRDFLCQVCNTRGMLQVLSPRYMRIRHYSHLNENGKPQFIYHRNEASYVEKVLRDQASTVTKQPKSIDHSDHNNHDLKRQDLGSNNENNWGRSLAWTRIPAWGAGDPGFKSPRPHHDTGSIFMVALPFLVILILLRHKHTSAR
jgi:hypothetical protein